jgi:hypothetical protein
MLIAGSEDGQYEPVAVVANVGEAREIAQDDFRSRSYRLENGKSPLCACAYPVRLQGRGPWTRRRAPDRLRDQGRHRGHKAHSVMTLMSASAPYRLYALARHEAIDSPPSEAAARACVACGC